MTTRTPSTTDPSGGPATPASRSSPATQSPTATATAPYDGTRTGYVTLVGRPNAGKSTLMNRLVGTHLSIVTPRAQTTWQRVTGILTEDDVQMIFLDTPGLLTPRDLVQRSMLAEAREAVREADVVLLVEDVTRTARDPEDGPEDPALLREILAEVDVPIVVALNKIDLIDAGAVERRARELREELDAHPVPVGALAGEGTDELLAALADALPPGPFLYPEEDIASQPVRFFVAELVRETVFEHFHQEVPYATFCQVEEFRASQDPVYIGVTVFVERKSQKGILVGKGGRAIRDLGRAAREKIEHFLGEAVYLDLWVKALPGWRRKRRDLARLGFRLPEDDDAATS